MAFIPRALIVISLVIPCAPCLAHIGKYTEIPRAKLVKGDEKAVLPGMDIPENPEKFVWKTTLKYNGNDLGFSNIRVFLFVNGRRTGAIGEIPEGTEVELNEVRSAGGNLYYSIPYIHNPKGPEPDKQYAWIQGAHIYAASKKAGGQ